MNTDIYSLAFAAFAATSFSMLVRRRCRLAWPRFTSSDAAPAPELAELIAFSEPGYKGSSREFSRSDRDLTLNGGDLIVRSILVIAGNWSLHSEADFQGNTVPLTEDGGPDADGSYPDPGHCGSGAPFHMRSIRINPASPAGNIRTSDERRNILS